MICLLRFCWWIFGDSAEGRGGPVEWVFAVFTWSVTVSSCFATSTTGHLLISILNPCGLGG